MAKSTARPKTNRRGFWLFVEGIASYGMLIGGIIFAISAAYLLWGLLGDSLRELNSLSETDRKRITGNVLFACGVMKTSGIVFVISTALRYYSEEVTGYSLFIVGALLYWGVPSLSGSVSGGLSVYVADTFMQVGLITIALCPPLVILDIVTRITDVRVPTSRDQAKGQDLLNEATHNSIFTFYCWQSPYCRTHLRRHCKAFQEHAACWRTKSGCFCDEDMILRTLQGNVAASAASNIQANRSPFTRQREYTPAQKRERCRQCFLYADHQNKKYRLLSPLVFPVAVFAIWTYHVPAKAYLGKLIDALAVGVGNMSFIPETQNVANQWASTRSASDSVEWIFLSCLGLIMATYMLRGLEYLIFELQI